MKLFRIQIPVIGLATILSLLISCHESKPKDHHGEIIGHTDNESDSLIFIRLHPNTILDTIKIVKGQFQYKFPSINYKRVKITRDDSTYQHGWCKNPNFRIVKMDILKRNGRKYKVYFLNKYYERPQYFDAIILDNNIIKITLVKDPNTRSFIKSTVEGSVETDKLLKSDYDRTMKRWKKGIKL